MSVNKAKIIFAVTAILFSIGFFLFSGTWIFVTAKRLYWQREQQQIAKWEARKTELGHIKQNQKEWDEIEAEFSAFKKQRFIPKIDFYTFRQNLEMMIRNNNLKKVSLRFDAKEKTMIDTEKIRFHVNIVGDYPSIKRFIEGLEDLPWMVLLDQAQLKLDNSQVEALLDLEVHFAS